MATVVIPTARLKLMLQTPEELLAWVESLPPAYRAEVSPDWIARVRITEAGDHWALGFMAVERSSGTVVGSCGFKGPPTADGVVEVAYGTEPNHRGKGYATEAARALTEFAFASGCVRLVCAHAKPDNGASARVLEKCGFRCIGEVIDPEDGPVFRWERGLSEPTSAP